MLRNRAAIRDLSCRRGSCNISARALIHQAQIPGSYQHRMRHSGYRLSKSSLLRCNLYPEDWGSRAPGLSSGQPQARLQAVLQLSRQRFRISLQLSLPAGKLLLSGRTFRGCKQSVYCSAENRMLQT